MNKISNYVNQHLLVFNQHLLVMISPKWRLYWVKISFEKLQFFSCQGLPFL